MTARTGMLPLIELVRGFTDAGTVTTIGTATYWSDDQVQTRLDRYRHVVRDAELEYETTYALTGDGSTSYLVAMLPDANSIDKSGWAVFLESEAGTVLASPFRVYSSLGSAIGTSSYSVDYMAGRVTFGADQAGSVWLGYARSYNVYLAAADIWREKAAMYAKGFDFKVEDHQIKGSQPYKQMLEMAEYYEELGTNGPTGSGYLTIVRTDTW